MKQSPPNYKRRKENPILSVDEKNRVEISSLPSDFPIFVLYFCVSLSLGRSDGAGMQTMAGKMLPKRFGSLVQCSPNDSFFYVLPENPPSSVVVWHLGK